MDPQYPILGKNQPKNLSNMLNLDFGMTAGMRQADSAGFGRRVRERRLELEMSQAELGKAAGYSQQNIVTIESGRVKRPQRAASEIAVALQTTREWLLWAEGPKDSGPQYFGLQKLVEKYKELPAPAKEAVTQLIENSSGSKPARRRTG
jgi:DNA-binding XRE family transcriptional regulator